MKKEGKNILDFDMLMEIDKQSIQSIESQLDETEQLIWASKPKFTFSITPLEIGGYDVALGPTNLYFIALGVNWFFCYRLYSNGSYIMSIFLFLLGLFLFLLPDIIKEIRRRNTYYAITNKHIFFKLWGIRNSKRRIEKFEIGEILDLRYEEYKDKSGVLYFMLKNPPNFKTYDFSAGGSRHYPTFENIDEVISLYERTWKIIKDTR